MSVDFTKSIVAILDARALDDIDNRTVGTGFVVSTDGLIVSCKHVIDSSYSDEVVYLLLYDPALPKTRRQIRRARLIPEYVRSAEVEDIVFLRLEDPFTPEQNIIPLPLGRSYHTQGQTFRTFGFPDARTEDGVFGECRVLGSGSENGVPLLQISSNQVSKGFSGAPVWDDRLQCVIGMVTSIIGNRTIRIAGKDVPVPSDPHGRQTETGFITPVETLTNVCPPLQVSEVSPYRGLSFFTEEDANFFFGRDQYIDKLLEKLRHNMRLLPVFGPSGSGKSSVIRAGLLPKLRAGALGDSARWHTLTIRPADDPFKQLAQHDMFTESTDIVESSKTWFAQHPQYTRFVLVIDQFEELLLLTPVDKRQEFVLKLTRLLSSSLSITVILIMRDDFYNQFVEHESLREWLERSGGATNVPPTLTATEVTSIVVEPARAVRLRFEEGLAQLIVRDMLETTPSAEYEWLIARSTNLPLLEFTLQQLWEKRLDGMLTYDAYHEIGGVIGGLTQWADKIFYDLGEKNETSQQQARRIFTELVRLGDENRRPPDSRRLLPLSALYHGEHEQKAIRQVVQQLADAKLLITAYDVQSKQEVVEIIHDALLWQWGQMREWLNKDRTFLMWHQRLELQAQEWVATNPERPARREKERLLPSSEIENAIVWLKTRPSDLSQSEQEFIQVSWHFKKRRATMRVMGGAALLTVASGSGVWWFRTQFQPFFDWLKYILGSYTDISSYSRHKGSVYCVGWSPEATRLASGSVDKTVQVFTSTGEYIYAYSGHVEAVSAIAWSPDGYRIASASGDKTVHVWYSDGQKPNETFVYKGHRDGVLTVAWSPDGRYIASGAGLQDKTAQIWDANTQRLLYQYQAHSGPINSLAWSPDGQRIASGSGDSTVHIWNSMNGELIFIYEGHKKPSHVISVAWSPNGKYIASAGFDGTVQVWSAENGRQYNVYRGHRNVEITSVTWSPDSKAIASASVDKTVQVWNAFDGSLICKRDNYAKVVDAVTWSPLAGDKRVASGNDNRVLIWQLKV